MHDHTLIGVVKMAIAPAVQTANWEMLEIVDKILLHRG